MPVPPEAPPPDLWSWRPVSAPHELSLDLVRADVTVVRRPGAPRIQVWNTGPIVLRVQEADDQVRIEDRYPPRLPGTWLECLPPPTSRGDIWAAAAPLRVRVEVAAGQRLQVHLGHGDIHAETSSGLWELRTGSGRVTGPEPRQRSAEHNAVS